MQALVDIICAVVAALAVSLFAHLGVDLSGADQAETSEVRRTAPAERENTAFKPAAEDDCLDEPPLRA